MNKQAFKREIAHQIRTQLEAGNNHIVVSIGSFKMNLYHTFDAKVVAPGKHCCMDKLVNGQCEYTNEKRCPATWFSRKPYQRASGVNLVIKRLRLARYFHDDELKKLGAQKLNNETIRP